MKNVIACRPGCFDVPLTEALHAVKTAGVDHVEVAPPPDDDYAGLARCAAEAGVTITSIGTGGKVDEASDIAAVERVIAGAAKIGTSVIFLSAGLGAGSRDDGIAGLRRLAETAHRAGVTISIETHLPFGHNGDVARETIAAVDSPGIGHNFDTANIYYYNPKGTDAIVELRKVLPWVTSVHLKESAHGEPKTADFPILGTGIVAFPEVFRLLGERGFTGPYTLELEGPLMAGQPHEERLARLVACVDYLRSIGATD